MPVDPLVSASSDPARRILEECERQVLRLRTGKLRIVDVADALGMSHANVHRFFKTRDVLLNALVDRWLKESEARAQDVLRRDAPAAERLTTMFVEMHRVKRDRIAAGPGVLEIYNQAMSKRAAAVAAHRDFLIGAVAGLVKDGIASGEFAVEAVQIPSILNALEAAMIKFTHPKLVAETLDDDTAAQARMVMAVFVCALRSSPDAFH
ncbi:MAG: hypothetical protein AAFQ67_00260 [Pseudomonadota bacterium]